MADAERELAREINSLEVLSLDQLRLRWQSRFGRTVSVHPSKVLLLRLYAYRLQAEAQGDLKTGTIQLLDRLGKESPAEGKPIPLPADLNNQGRLKTGTVLVRQHAGVNHHVRVVQGGFSWNDQTFFSLSQVATAITGTRWNGRRFFGLPSGKGLS